MLLRRVTETKYGEIVDYLPGHIPDYLLFVRIDETKIKELESALPKKWAHAITSNMGDRRCYSFMPRLTQEKMQNIIGTLCNLGAQAFEFKDWTNQISPPTRERVLETKYPIHKS